MEDVISEHMPAQDRTDTEQCILKLDIWNLPINRSSTGIDKIAVDLRETAASVEFSDG